MRHALWCRLSFSVHPVFPLRDGAGWSSSHRLPDDGFPVGRRSFADIAQIDFVMFPGALAPGVGEAMQPVYRSCLLRERTDMQDLRTSAFLGGFQAQPGNGRWILLGHFGYAYTDVFTACLGAPVPSRHMRGMNGYPAVWQEFSMCREAKSCVASR